MSNVLSRSSFLHHENNGISVPNFPKESHLSSSSTVSHRTMIMEANTGVHSQVPGRMSGASISKFEGCTFNILYINSNQNPCNNQPTIEKSWLVTTPTPIKALGLFFDIFLSVFFIVNIHC